MDLRPSMIVICLVFAVFLLAPSGSGAGEPKSGGALRIGYVQDMTGLDPHTSGGFPAAYIQQNLFQSLVTLDEHLEIVPELAESWDVQDGGKTYVFHLRRGVQFHDETPFDAHAVKWNFDRLLNPEEAVLFRGFFASVETVEVVDAHTVRITQQYPSQMLLPALASYGLTGFLMISPTSYQRWGRKELSLHPAGTGPFRFAKWEPNSIILLERHPRYWKPGLPYLDRLEVKIIKEGVTRTTALRRGEVDFANRVPVEQVGLMAKDPRIRLFTGPETGFIFTNFNQSRKPFDDIRVRQALAGYGLNREELARTAFLGHARPQISMVPVGARGHIDFPELYPYDPERAKRLLREAGFNERTPLRYLLLANPVNVTVATVVKTQLEKLGVVHVTVDVPDHPAFIKRQLVGDYDQQVSQTYPYLDLGASVRLFMLKDHGGLDLAHARDAKADLLADQFVRAADPQAWQQRAESLARYVAEQASFLGLTTIPFFDAARAEVEGFRFRRHLKLDFETVWVDR
jgi:peptide/nickel transport system substrate-binding protein